MWQEGPEVIVFIRPQGRRRYMAAPSLPSRFQVPPPAASSPTYVHLRGTWPREEGTDHPLRGTPRALCGAASGTLAGDRVVSGFNRTRTVVRETGAVCPACDAIRHGRAEAPVAWDPRAEARRLARRLACSARGDAVRLAARQ